MLEDMASKSEAQSAAAVLMVRPAAFGFNPQTALSNAFQRPLQRAERIDVTARALEEFDGLLSGLERAGVEIVLADDTSLPMKPDALFPNNWVSFHHDGTVVLYPLLAPNRRAERREAVIRKVVEQGRYRVTRTVDLSYRENGGQYLEGTGSLVLDRTRRVAYASLSPRTHLDVLGEFAQLLDYDLVTFESFDDRDTAVYHTNVLMALGAKFAVICGAAIRQARHREAVYKMLRDSEREIIDITLAQMKSFAGNLLELAPKSGNLIALSTTAWRSLDKGQRALLEKYGQVLAAEIPVIERFGGGGVRCMLAEIHLPAAR
jgi:hypothetical protein